MQLLEARETPAHPLHRFLGDIACGTSAKVATRTGLFSDQKLTATPTRLQIEPVM